MRNQFVPYKLALRLKDLGFDEICLAFYDINKNFIYFQIHTIVIKAPTWGQVFDWFRAQHGLVGYIAQDLNPTPEPSKWFFAIQKSNLSNEKDHLSRHCYKTYEDARLECVEHLIRIAETYRYIV